MSRLYLLFDGYKEASYLYFTSYKNTLTQHNIVEKVLQQSGPTLVF